MNRLEEDRFDQLPEALRLALLEDARRRLKLEQTPLPLTQISEATGIPYEEANKRLTAALLKLRRRAAELEIEP